MSSDPFSGFWALVPEQSKLAGPLPRRWTETLQVAEDTIRVREEIAGADGQTLTVTLAAAFDGRDYPVTGSPLADVIAYTRPDRYRIDAVAKKNGRVVLTESVTASQDGQLLTMGYVMRLPDGRDVASVAVFKRQLHAVDRTGDSAHAPRESATTVATLPMAQWQCPTDARRP